MPVDQNGEKWACEACVRGHRVSNCQHTDRPLQHINKKGRPVSQCQHCRSMRKSRASHVKCDCGEKSHKCAHLKTTVEGHRDTCCCNHGGRCTCSHKKEPPQLDPVPESDSDDHEATTRVSKTSCAKGGVRSRRRANTLDGMLTFDENGRHKPTYKHVKASSKCEPYPLKRVNSMHSASGMSTRSADGIATGRESSSRRVKSETASPLMANGSNGMSSSGSGAPSGTFAHLNGQLPPLDLSGIEYPRYVNHGGNGFDMFGSLSDHEQPMFSAGLSATSVDWSHYDGLETGAFSSSLGQGRSYGNGGGGAFDFSGSEQAPPMTTTTSGDVSEVEDFMGPNPDDFDVSGAFGMTQPPHPATAADLSSLDYDDFKLPKDPSSFATAGAAFADDPLFWMNDYSHGLPTMTDPTDPASLFWESSQQ